MEYVREDGSIPFKKWFDDLDPAAAAKVAAAQVRLSQGNTSSVKWFSGLGEYVIDWGPGYRMYLARDGEKLIVPFSAAERSGGSSATSRGPRNCSPNTRPAGPR